ncbi:hypothetical protein GCM10027048_04780 [Hymenobacter coalescens]
MINPFDPAAGQSIRGVFAKVASEGSALSIEALELQLETHSIRLNIDFDTDEIISELLATGVSTLADHPLLHLQWIIGQQLIGIWTGENNRGYSDFMAFGIGEFVPTVVVCAIASELDIRVFNPPGRARRRTS